MNRRRTRDEAFMQDDSDEEVDVEEEIERLASRMRRTLRVEEKRPAEYVRDILQLYRGFSLTALANGLRNNEKLRLEVSNTLGSRLYATLKKRNLHRSVKVEMIADGEYLVQLQPLPGEGRQLHLRMVADALEEAGAEFEYTPPMIDDEDDSNAGITMYSSGSGLLLNDIAGPLEFLHTMDIAPLYAARARFSLDPMDEVVIYDPQILIPAGEGDLADERAATIEEDLLALPIIQSQMPSFDLADILGHLRLSRNKRENLIGTKVYDLYTALFNHDVLDRVVVRRESTLYPPATLDKVMPTFDFSDKVLIESSGPGVEWALIDTRIPYTVDNGIYSIDVDNDTAFILDFTFLYENDNYPLLSSYKDYSARYIYPNEDLHFVHSEISALGM